SASSRGAAAHCARAARAGSPVGTEPDSPERARTRTVRHTGGICSLAPVVHLAPGEQRNLAGHRGRNRMAPTPHENSLPRMGPKPGLGLVNIAPALLR